MSPPYVLVREATGDVPVSAPAIDSVAAYIGTAQGGNALSPTLFGRAEALATIHGEGPGVRHCGHSLKRTKTPAVFVRTPSASDGTYDPIDVSGVTGTAIVSVDDTALPLNDYDLYMIVTRSGTLGTSGAGSIKFKYSRSGGRKLSGEIGLGAAFSYQIPNTGSKFLFDPPAGVLVSAATQMRTKMLAHFADITVHDNADTSAAQVALNAASAPTTNAEAWAVLNLCRAAWEEHRLNAPTAASPAHNGPDPNAVSAPVATDSQSGITLFADLKTLINTHEGIHRAADPVALLASTATVAAPVTILAAGLLSGGKALLLAYPCRLTFTTAGTTPSDAPATATITGTDVNDAPISEVLNLSQVGGSVTSTKCYKTIVSIVYSTADGTGATVSIGVDQAVHNSADATNTITASTPVRGTLNKGDVIQVRTHGPKWDSDGLDQAFSKLAETGLDFSMVFVSGEVSESDALSVSTGLDTLYGMGKRVGAVVYARPINKATAEKETDWIDSVAAEFSQFVDDRIMVCAGTAWVTDAVTAEQFDTTFAHAVMARLVSIDRFESPSFVDRGALEGVTLVDNAGNRIGYDASWIGGLDEARFCVLHRLPDPPRRAGAYVSHPFVMKGPEGRVSQFQVRRVLNAAERAAASISFGQLGGKTIYDPETHLLGENDADSIAASIKDQLSVEFANDISNPNADDLVEIDRSVTVDGDDAFVTVTVNMIPFKYIGGITLVFNLKI